MIKTITAALASALVASPLFAEQREWTLDLGHAHIGWEIDHMDLARTVGRFDDFEGTFLIDEDDPANSSITVTVDAASVNSNHVGRDNHIRNADYLNVPEFPTVTFTSGEITMTSETEGMMDGTLTMLGVTAPVTLDFTLVADRTYPDFIPNYDEIRTASFEATGKITRTDWGMDFIAFPGSPTGLEIDLDIHVDLVDCATVPAEALPTNVPCNWGYAEGFTGPNEG
ncbi:YceI family protein [Cognatiyoonia sp. IB215182]|uniref:YceI family protein n=1 Tax=Cognatiyoonia sp. IB215182 TaxID=3097353 RepID=UPI002A0E38EA|nr:YceI family protein [Cognatiyoonia sp. IB215182]MDX8354023.1 YceI family protein [Cognatiyoonia sp. IB215182]